MKYKLMSQPFNAVQFTYIPDPSHDILFCCFAPLYLSSDRFDSVWCDFFIDGDKWSSTYAEYKDDIFELNLDHVFL